MKPAFSLSKNQTPFLFIGFAAVYLSGLFIPLMENDSAQHASMAMRMALTGDFLHIYKGENAYLDKPQMHFWLAALSMKIFGINQFAYRFPALICLALAAFSTKKISEILYKNSEIGNLAALIFLSAQTIILSAHDVRTDAVLTGFIAAAIWQILLFIKSQKISAAAFGGLAMAFAFSSKGMMAVVIIGFCIFSYLLYSREWKRFFNGKILILIIAFIVGISPVLYAYYMQFGAEGIRFILFNQSVNRLNGNGFDQGDTDYFFFFHTLLWAFLPFSLAFYFGVFERSKWFLKEKFRKENGVEFLTLGGFWMVMLLFSASKFKLPHYLNGLIPVISVFTAGYLYLLVKIQKFKTYKLLYIIQLVVIFASLILILLLTFYFSGVSNILLYNVDSLLFIYLIYTLVKRENLVSKYIFASLLFAVAVNLYLNTQFYPELTQYQGSIKLAKYVNQQRLPKEKIFMLTGDESWNFDFYTKRNTPRVSQNILKNGDYLIINDEQIPGLKRNYQIIRTESDYAVTRLSLKFMNRKTRSEELSKMFLVQILK